MVVWCDIPVVVPTVTGNTDVKYFKSNIQPKCVVKKGRMFCFAALLVAPAVANVQFTIMHFNDFHSRIDPDSETHNWCDTWAMDSGMLPTSLLGMFPENVNLPSYKCMQWDVIYLTSIVALEYCFRWC